MRILSILLLCAPFADLSAEEKPEKLFPAELTQFKPYVGNPVFRAAGKGKWDARIRERGWILRETDEGKPIWRMWYTGYDGTRAGVKKLGLATSSDGLVWKRHKGNPVYQSTWCEDMMLLKRGGSYWMFAEGAKDQAQLLQSKNGVQWKRIGRLDVRLKSGKPIPAGPYGTPTAFHENRTWYLFYERRDAGVWLATSKDRKVWRNVSDEPVLKPGPEKYDARLIALNQIVKHNGRYYALYHGTGSKASPATWCTCLAVSDDLIRWKKYPGNPLLPLKENKSSGILIRVGNRFRLYTMHDEVHVHFGARFGNASR